MLRFKAPTLVELVTPSAQPGIYSVPLTRDVKIINAFAFGGSPSTETSGFQIFTVCQGTRQNISKVMPLRQNETTYLNELDTEWLTLRTGWILGVEVTEAVQANVYIWAIPLPAPNR